MSHASVTWEDLSRLLDFDVSRIVTRDSMLQSGGTGRREL